MRDDRQPQRESLRIASIYALIGGAWIFFSDKLAEMLSSETGTLTQIAMLKGWLYVLLTALLLYKLIHRSMRQLAESQEALCSSEERYRTLVQSVNSIILRLDPEGRITFLNEYAQTFFGYKPEEILGRPALGTIVPEIDSSGFDLREKIQDVLAHPERYVSSENENMRKDGERVWIAWTNRALMNERGELDEILCVGNDMTERRRAEEELRQYAEELRARNEELARFNVAVVDRELRMVELKKQINDLSLRLGGPAPYPLTFLDDEASEELDADSVNQKIGSSEESP